MTVTIELIDSLLADYKKPEDLIGENGLLKLLIKRSKRWERCSGGRLRTSASSASSGIGIENSF